MSLWDERQIEEKLEKYVEKLVLIPTRTTADLARLKSNAAIVGQLAEELAAERAKDQ